MAPPGLLAQLEALLQRFVDLMRLRERMPPLRQAILREGVSA